MAVHVVLSFAANHHGSSERNLSEETIEIQRNFGFESRWTVGINQLMRNLNELERNVGHRSEHGGSAGMMPQDEQ